MLKIGLTGGIGCGKTSVSNIFSDLQIPVIDADELAHALVQPGKPALLEIAQVFGDDILLANGSLNRPRLKAIIFYNPQQKRQLEAILHPRVYHAMQDQLTQLNAPYCILSIPLLFETNRRDLVNRVLVVDCPQTLQIERARRRDNLSESQVQTIIDSQVTRQYRLEHADDILDNSVSSAELAENVKKLHNFYLSISAASGYPRL